MRPASGRGERRQSSRSAMMMMMVVVRPPVDARDMPVDECLAADQPRLTSDGFEDLGTDGIVVGLRRRIGNVEEKGFVGGERQVRDADAVIRQFMSGFMRPSRVRAVQPSQRAALKGLQGFSPRQDHQRAMELMQGSCDLIQNLEADIDVQGNPAVIGE